MRFAGVDAMSGRTPHSSHHTFAIAAVFVVVEMCWDVEKTAGKTVNAD
jgi:hypothetical protein